MIFKIKPSEKFQKNGESGAPVGSLPFLGGMGAGYLLYYFFLSLSDELWGAGIVFGIFVMPVLMQKFGMNFEFSESRIINNRKEFNKHILSAAKLTSVFFVIAWIFISNALHVQHLSSTIGLLVGVGVFLIVQFCFNILFSSALVVVNSFKSSLSYRNFIVRFRFQLADVVNERSIPVPLAPPRFASLIARP